MFCRNCGKEISNNICFCKYCGTKLRSSAKRERLAEENTRGTKQEISEFSGYYNYSRNRPEIRGLQLYDNTNNMSELKIAHASIDNTSKVLTDIANIDIDARTTKLTLKPILCVGYDSYKRFSSSYLVTRKENDGLRSSKALREIEQFSESGTAFHYIKRMTSLKVVYRKITEVGLEEYVDNLVENNYPMVSAFDIVSAISFILITEDIFKTLVKYTII